jgi:tetraacyldisaccharide 4'-kinase
MNNSSFRWYLLPFSLIYGLITGIRNILFNLEVLASKSFDVPVISIGNITVGGTGKTPHTEFLIRALSKHFNVAVLSRGYKRKTKGFVLADSNKGWKELGDEPTQLKLKFPDLTVAVDENRCRGIERLMESTNPYVEVVLLDDAFQHRKVSPSISILLIDYNRQLKNDWLLPAGNLRESAGQVKRAQIIIVTKCPADLKPMDIRILGSRIDPLSYQLLFFTTQVLGPLHPVLHKEPTVCYSDPVEVSSDAQNQTEPSLQIPESLEKLHASKRPALLVTGIATPRNMEASIREYVEELHVLSFADHHEFNKRDVKKIHQEFEKIRTQGGIILTTEKDAVRIRDNQWMSGLLPHMYYPSLEIQFLGNEEESFLHKIIDYVKINRRIRRVS